MAKLKKYDLTGREIGEVTVPESFLDIEISGQMLKDYIVAIRQNARQWSASTQGRSEVNHSTKKPHPQKGGGRARQGRLSSPQYKGGGVVFGPKPKFDQHQRINRKERRKVIHALISEKIKNQHVYILQDDALEVPKTKVVSNFLKTLNLKKRVLFLGEGTSESVDNKPVSVHSTTHQALRKSMSNLQHVEFQLAQNVSGYDLLLAQDLVITEEALVELQKWLQG